jgi:hypothetical protein
MLTVPWSLWVLADIGRRKIFCIFPANLDNEGPSLSSSPPSAFFLVKEYQSIRPVKLFINSKVALFDACAVIFRGRGLFLVDD